MDTAPLDSPEIIIVSIHKMHSPDKQRILMKFTQGVKVLFSEYFTDDLSKIC